MRVTVHRVLKPFFAVTKLNEVRRDHGASHNRVDVAMADVFNLLSMFFMRIGKNRELPATYCQIVSIRVGISPAPSGHVTA